MSAPLPTPSSSSAASHVDLGPLLAELEAERALSETIRTAAKEVDSTVRALQAGLNRVHSTPASSVPSLVLSLAPTFAQLRERVQDVIAVVPDGQFWKWSDCWSFALQRASYCAAMAYWLTTGQLITKEQACHILGSECRDGGLSIHPAYASFSDTTPTLTHHPTPQSQHRPPPA